MLEAITMKNVSCKYNIWILLAKDSHKTHKSIWQETPLNVHLLHPIDVEQFWHSVKSVPVIWCLIIDGVLYFTTEQRSHLQFRSSGLQYQYQSPVIYWGIKYWQKGTEFMLQYSTLSRDHCEERWKGRGESSSILTSILSENWVQKYIGHYAFFLCKAPSTTTASIF